MEGEEFFDRQREEQNRIREEEYGKDGDKKKSTKNGYLTIDRVTEQVENDEQSGDDETEEKKRIEQAKNKTHKEYFLLTSLLYHRKMMPTIISLDDFLA